MTHYVGQVQHWFIMIWHLLSAVNARRATGGLLAVACAIVVRCQAKVRLPIAYAGCTFEFSLPGQDSKDQVEEQLFYTGMYGSEIFRYFR